MPTTLLQDTSKPVKVMYPLSSTFTAKCQTMRMTHWLKVCHQVKLFPEIKVFCRDPLCVNRCILKPIWPKWLFLAIPLPTSKCLWYITTQLKAARQHAWFERKLFIYWHYTEKLRLSSLYKNRSRNLKLLLKITIFLLEKTIMDICQILMTVCQSHPNPAPPCFQELVFLL